MDKVQKLSSIKIFRALTIVENYTSFRSTCYPNEEPG